MHKKVVLTQGPYLNHHACTFSWNYLGSIDRVPSNDPVCVEREDYPSRVLKSYVLPIRDQLI